MYMFLTSWVDDHTICMLKFLLWIFHGCGVSVYSYILLKTRQAIGIAPNALSKIECDESVDLSAPLPVLMSIFIAFNAPSRFNVENFDSVHCESEKLCFICGNYTLLDFVFHKIICNFLLFADFLLSFPWSRI